METAGKAKMLTPPGE